MIMSWIWAGMVLVSTLFALALGRGSALAASIPQGAQAGVTLAVSMAGSICLWSGVGKLMERSGITGALSRLLDPLLRRVFPGTRRDPVLRGYLSANICANLLGLGNAATPLGIQAAKRMVRPNRPGIATDELCRLVVLNTASIQLLPTTVASLRAAAGCATPFDILLPVWLTSACALAAGLLAAKGLARVWP